ncbi:transketolase [Pseudodesulfovibrio sp. zrk46]|uniref:transketolase n=1 Tax=Pseudodesulfovibrio sp. zrk46 TaxID=2725288 RepID=UPI0014498631|nr:transketolase [Pseudodesulfovibrio sp. zrk46]QJB55725.1 transketolase [Pseudodesulfovibrio sp. zrk46]
MHTQIRKDILNISFESGHGHIPTCFSIVELLQTVYETMNHKPADPQWNDRDIFILSKGHAALAHYVVLARQGYFDLEPVCTFGGCGSQFGCHGDRSKTPGVEVSTGSLGHGIGVAVGMAMAFKIQKSDRRVISLIGDGEANEGSVWEALLVAADQKLDKLTVIYDNNMSHARGLQIHNPAEKLASFGMDVTEIDGHDPAQIRAALEKKSDMPKAIVANTVKGQGIAEMMENHYPWHRRSPSEEELKRFLEELDARTV